MSKFRMWTKKNTSEKPNFCSITVFSLYFNLEQKKFTPQNHSLFRSISCFGVTKITTPISTSKIMKMCEQILKKNIAGRIPETTRSENLFNRPPSNYSSEKICLQ